MTSPILNVWELYPHSLVLPNKHDLCKSILVADLVTIIVQQPGFFAAMQRDTNSQFVLMDPPRWIVLSSTVQAQPHNNFAQLLGLRSYDISAPLSTLVKRGPVVPYQRTILRLLKAKSPLLTERFFRRTGESLVFIFEKTLLSVRQKLRFRGVDGRRLRQAANFLAPIQRTRTTTPTHRHDHDTDHSHE